MELDPSVVIFDACVLYPFHLRNIVVQIAVDRLVDARWSDEIHDERIRQTPDVFLTNLYDKAPELALASLANARRNLGKTRISAPEFIDILQNQKLTQLATRAAKRTSDL
jgi:hypothetical protein